MTYIYRSYPSWTRGIYHVTDTRVRKINNKSNKTYFSTQAPAETIKNAYHRRTHIPIILPSFSMISRTQNYTLIVIVLDLLLLLYRHLRGYNITNVRFLLNRKIYNLTVTRSIGILWFVTLSSHCGYFFYRLLPDQIIEEWNSENTTTNLPICTMQWGMQKMVEGTTVKKNCVKTNFYISNNIYLLLIL